MFQANSVLIQIHRPPIFGPSLSLTAQVHATFHIFLSPFVYNDHSPSNSNLLHQI